MSNAVLECCAWKQSEGPAHEEEIEDWEVNLEVIMPTRDRLIAAAQYANMLDFLLISTIPHAEDFAAFAALRLKGLLRGTDAADPMPEADVEKRLELAEQIVSDAPPYTWKRLMDRRQHLDEREGRRD